MRKIVGEKKKTQRNRFTRMCMGDALVNIMQQKAYDKISVSDIVKKAGVSRMTYYNYYETKDELVKDYIEEITSLYLEEEKNNIMDYVHILFLIKFFDRYGKFFVTLADAGMYSFIIDAANIIMEKEYKDNYSTSDDADFLKKKTYELYFYSGAMVNVFLQWQKNGKNITPEELAGIITDYLLEYVCLLHNQCIQAQIVHCIHCAIQNCQ